MRIAITKPLFAWDCLEDSPPLQTMLRRLGEVVPDLGKVTKVVEWFGYKLHLLVDVHRVLHKAQIKPLIENRSLWKEEQERMRPGPIQKALQQKIAA